MATQVSLCPSGAQTVTRGATSWAATRPRKRMSSQEDGGTAIVDLTRDGSSSPNPSDAPMAMTEDSSDLEEIVMENAGIDEEARRQNVENRRARLARFGIDEAAGRARANAARRASVNEVIVISDNEDEGTNAPENMDIDEDRFAFERQRHRERRDEWAARPARGKHNRDGSVSHISS